MKQIDTSRIKKLLAEIERDQVAMEHDPAFANAIDCYNQRSKNGKLKDFWNEQLTNETADIRPENRHLIFW